MKTLLLLIVLIICDFQVLYCQSISRPHRDTAGKKNNNLPIISGPQSDTTSKKNNKLLSSTQHVTSAQNIKLEQPNKSPELTTAEKVQVLTSVLQILATLLIAWAVYKQTNQLSKANREQVELLNKANSEQTDKIKRLEMHGQAIQALNVLNQVAVSSDYNLIALDTLGREDIHEEIELRRKRWCTFIWLESLQLTFFGKEKNLIDHDYAERTLRQQLEVILKDEFVFDLVSNRGFDKRFVDYCKGIKESLPKSNKTTTQA